MVNNVMSDITEKIMTCTYILVNRSTSFVHAVQKEGVTWNKQTNSAREMWKPLKHAKVRTCPLILVNLLRKQLSCDKTRAVLIVYIITTAM